jgi:photosystem II stability/assembly factor-like uncharacterized protein
MLRSLSIAAAGTGVAALLVIACSGGLEPTTGVFQTPEQASPSSGGPSGGPTLTPQASGTVNRLQAVSPVNASVVWASGVGGTFTVTTDGGDTWRAGVVPGAEALQFRDVEGVDARTAYLLSAGSGTDSRIYKTTNGGRIWKLQFQNEDPNAFYDCFDFWTPDRGITFSDAVNGRFPAIKTTNGRTWRDIGDQMPEAQAGEAAFAASGTCVATQGGKRAWIATGAAEKARILATTDGGATWDAYDTPIVQGTPSSGGFSVAFRDPFRGILAGGELDTDPDLPQGPNVAVSTDGGKSWSTDGIGQNPFPGAIFGLSYVPGFGQRTVVATGPGGTAWSRNEGRSWTNLPADVTGFWAVAFAGRKAGWLVGTEGRIIKLSF